jgi:hypothetical protein
MHKNAQVAFCKDEQVLKVLRKDMLPIGTTFDGKKYNLKNWLNKRMIPTTRDNYSVVENWLKETPVKASQFHFHNYGVSVNDCYWFYKVKTPLHFKLMGNKRFASKIPAYKTISLYEHFESNDSPLQILAENKITTPEMVNLKYPDNTTGGNITKYWTIRQNQYYLVKQNNPKHPLTAEKIIASQILCDIINNTRMNLNSKKADIETASYFYEPGKTPIESCCYAKCFTDVLSGLTTWAHIETQQGKTMSIKDMMEFINPSSIQLKEYIDFIILFDYLTENKRTKDDIGFIIGNDSNRVVKPAPLYSFSQTFDYMDKDYERVYKKEDAGNYVNVFGMTTEEQIDYIANIDWMDNRELFQSIGELKDYFETDADRRQLTLTNLETICNILNHKLYHIENKKYEIAEAEGTLEELGFERRDDDDDDEDESSY